MGNGTANKRRAAVAAVCAVILAAALIAAALFVFPDLFKEKDPVREQRVDFVSDAVKEGRELRGVYIATVGNLNFPSERGLSDDELLAELDGVVASCVKYGFNTVIFQVRPASDAFYESDIFPASAYLSGTQGVAPEVDILKELCERAHARDVAVIAWVNPLRVGKIGAFELSADNPASVHPEYCVDYGGVRYYDAGIPQVRDLVARGCAEIAAGYDVDAILFDDYFYPYPVDGEEFDDADTYAEYGGGADKDDWRRSNVNAMIEACSDAITAADPECSFGVAPFGIWRNDDGSNGGSATRGLDAYSEIYCDALAWAKGGYVDFLAPQIYWSFDTDVARYGVLADWWIEALEDTGVPFLTSNAAYKAAQWDDPRELEKQIEYNRATGACAGEFIYGYSAILADENGVVSCLASAFEDDG